jgi:GTP-binding protein
MPPETEQEIARKAREDEAEAWAKEMARAKPTPYVVGDPANAADDEDGEEDDEAGDEAGDAPGSVEDVSKRWDAAMAADSDEPPAIAFVGRPNVGKSSLLNALIGDNRMIVSAIPGTTRDAIDTTIPWGRSEVVLIDTAGIKKRGRVANGPAAEKYSTMRALKAISRADVAVLILDAHDGLTAQDAHVAGYVIEEGRGLIIAVNKWDIVEDKTHKSFDEFVAKLRRELPFIDYAPIVSISALTGQRVQRVLELAVDVWGERRKRIGTGELNRLIAASIERNPPAVVHGKRAKIRYATQAGVAPPTFVLFATDPASIHFSYRRYLENRIREAYGFDGTPIRLVFREQVREKRPKGRSSPTRKS